VYKHPTSAPQAFIALHMTEHRADRKLFGRFEPLVLLVLGFLLLAIIGAGIAQRYQTRSADRAVAEKVFTEMADLLDSRLYRMRRIASGYTAKVDADEMNRRWLSYYDVLDRWNGSLNGHLALLQRYFGERWLIQLATDLQPRFSDLNDLLEKAKAAQVDKERQDALAAFRQNADVLNDKFYNFDLELLQILSKM